MAGKKVGPPSAKVFMFMCVRNYFHDTLQKSFYVCDDEKSIAIVDLLEFSRFKTTTVEFFLDLLKDLTCMMDAESDQVEPKLVSADVDNEGR